MITQARLRELFLYDDGKLVRRVSVKGSNAGTSIGTMKPKGYIVAQVDGKMYRLHHLVWMYFYGEFVEELDHENHNRGDNRIGNLRPCTHQQNLGNMRPKVHKYKGVTFCKSTRKWRAQIGIDYKNKPLGRYKTIEEAALAYNEAALEQFGEFALLNEIEDAERN